MTRPFWRAGHPSPGMLAVVGVLLLFVGGAPCFGDVESTPLESLREQERKHRDRKGEVYLGNPLTLYYPVSSVDPGKEDHPLLLELTDVLKTPLRKNYRLVLRGYPHAAETRDLRISAERVERLKEILVRTYGLEGTRVSTEGLGRFEPVSARDTPEGRAPHGRVEIHVYGDVSESTRFTGNGH